MKIYLAGPDVFREDAIYQGELLKGICKEYGYEGLYPLDNEVDTSSPDMALKVFEANYNMIKECDIILANIERFRGPSAYVGTVWEMGTGYALGKQVILYNSDLREYKEVYTDKDTNFPLIEDFGLPDNLMLIYGSNGVYGDFIEAIKAIRSK